MPGTLRIFEPSGRIRDEAYTEKSPPYDQLNAAVGGYIERVPLQGAYSGEEAFVNEEGAYLGLPLNFHAQLKDRYNRPLRGNLVIVLSKPRSKK